MGIYLVYNELSHKWELSGWGFIWEYDTKEEAEADKAKAWKHHNEKLKAWNCVMNMLMSYR